MDLVVAYDIRTDSAEGRRRLRKVAQVCLNYGQRVQYSVFECRVDERTFVKLRRGLEQAIKSSEDSVRIYWISPSDTWIAGVDHYIDFDEPLLF